MLTTLKKDLGNRRIKKLLAKGISRSVPRITSDSKVLLILDREDLVQDVSINKLNLSEDQVDIALVRTRPVKGTTPAVIEVSSAKFTLFGSWIKETKDWIDSSTYDLILIQVQEVSWVLEILLLELQPALVVNGTKDQDLQMVSLTAMAATNDPTANFSKMLRLVEKVAVSNS